MLIKKLVQGLYDIGEQYRQKKARGPAVLFDKLIMAVLEWSGREKIKQVDSNNPEASSMPERIVDHYSHIRKDRDLACKILRLALNQAPFEDYLKIHPIPPKLNLPYLRRESSNPDRVSDEGEWDGSWDNAVSRYEDDDN